MKFLSKVLTVLVFSALLSGCSDIPDADNPGNTISNTSIATITQQLDAIQESLPLLKSTLNSIKSLLGLDLRSKTSDNGSINGVKDYIRMLEDRIDLLEEYVQSNDNGQWLETTYATIEMYEETVTILAVLQGEIDAMKNEFSASQEKLYKEFKQNIADSYTSMKGWVNEQLTGYYDIATVDAIILQLQRQIEGESADVIEDVASMREELMEQMSDLENTYKEVIKEAIEKNNGTLTDELSKSIEKVNSDLQKSLSDINRRLDDIENRLSKLEGTVEELLKRIQSISYVPIHADNKARVVFPNEDTSGGTLQLDFIITDESVVTELAKVFKDVVKVRAMYIGSPTQIELIATNCVADSNQGLFSITVACDNMDMDFYNGSKDARVIMNISDGISNHNSGYIDVVAYNQQIPDNQIWYKTSDNSVISLQKGTGPNILSNVYDPLRKQCVVTFDQNITTIPNTYFYANPILTSVTLPNSVLCVEAYAFDQCFNLSEVWLGNSLEGIGMCAFRWCSFSTLHIPQSLKWVDSAAILSDNQMDFTGAHISEDGKCLIIDNSLKACARGGIRGSYTLPSGIVDIQCVGASMQTTEIIIPEGVKSIGQAAMQGCGISRIVLPESLEILDAGSMSYNEYLTEVVFLSKTPPVLGNNAFYNCPVLTQITIPSIRETVIAYETSDWPKGYKALLSWDVNIFSDRIIEYTTNASWPVSCGEMDIVSHKFNNGKGYILLDESVNEFKGFRPHDTDLTDVTIPSCITIIGDNAFSNSFNLEHVSLPSGLTSIGNCAFHYCSKLKNIELPDSVVEIGEYAFYYCSNFESKSLPKNLTSLGAYAFMGCTGLSSISLSKLQEIPDYAFANCIGIRELLVPETLDFIGDGAFSDCLNLEKITFLRESAPEFGDNVFYACNPDLVVIPSTEVAYKSYLASKLDSHLKIRIPNWEDYIPNTHKLIYSTNNNEPLTIEDRFELLSHKYENGNGLIILAKPFDCLPFFDYNKNLISIEIPEGVKRIDERQFFKCSNLNNIVIPDGLEEIGDSAFYGTAIRNVVLPESVVKIYANAFVTCKNLTSVRLLSMIPPVCDSRIFGGVDNLTIYVPQSAVQDYKVADGWSYYSSCIVGY